MTPDTASSTPDYTALFGLSEPAPAAPVQDTPKTTTKNVPNAAAARRITPAPTPAVAPSADDLPAADAAPATAPAPADDLPTATPATVPTTDPRRAALQTPAALNTPQNPLTPEALKAFVAVVAERANAPDFRKAATPEARRRLLLYAQTRLETGSTRKAHTTADLDAAAIAYARKRSPSFAALLDDIELIIKNNRVQSIEDALSRDAEGLAPEKGHIPPNHKTAKLFLSANDPRYKATGETAAPVVNIQLNL